MQVTQYTWGQDSAIARIDVRKLESGSLEAYIHAPSTSAAGELAAVPQHLVSKGYSAVPDNINGQDMLRVSGFKKAEDLIGALGEGSYVGGKPQEQVVGEKEHKSFTDQVRKQTVKLSGLFGIIGHAALGAVGVMEGDMKRVATSAFYTTSTLIPTVYGAGKDGGAGKVITDMKEYLAKQGVEIPQGDNLTADELAKKGGVIETLHGYIQKHPIEISNAIGLMGNVMLTYSGLKGGEKVEAMRTSAGLASMLGALTTILVQEKGKNSVGQYDWPGMENVPGTAAPDMTPEQVAEHQENRSMFGKIADFVQERPMRTSGLLNVGGNLAMLADAHKMHKNAQNSISDLDARIAGATGDEKESLLAGAAKHKLKANATGVLGYTTAATYLIATAFTSLSSKTKVSDYNEQEMLGKLCAMSANFIMDQPAELRDEVISKSAIYLSKQPDVKQGHAEIVSLLNEKIDALAHSPWAARVDMQRVHSAGTQAQGATI